MKKKKNSNYSNTANNNGNTAMGKEKRTLITVMAIFASVVLVFGIVMGTIAIIRSSSAFVKYEGIMMGEGESNYFVSNCKAKFMTKVRNKIGSRVYDTESFWNSDAEAYGYKGKTYGELLDLECEAYIRGIMVGSYLFDKYSSLTKEQKKAIDKSVEETVSYQADGDIEKFNELTAEYGFDYSSFKKAAYLEYKASHSLEMIYGKNGEVLSQSQEYIDQCNEYYESYHSAKLLFIRHYNTFVYDENGKPVFTTDINGETVQEMQILGSDEIASRKEVIAEIRQYIDAKKNNLQLEFSISPEYMETLQKKYSGENEEDHIVGGYYFAPNSSYTVGFPIQSVVSEIYEMQIGEFSIVEYDEDEDGFAEGSCIIYKQNPEELGYTKSYNEDFFTDFYADASYYQYNKMLNILGEDVVFTDKYNSIDTVAIPYNTTVIVKFDG